MGSLADVALALYRKYRPAKFAEVVGQEHVTDPLRTALESGRINHAYLFSGPRGCGKTSSARILARSLNCVQGPTPEPCGVCASCVSLAPGGPGNIDVTELDAASHGGVDDTRELRDRAFFAPAESRYRVFIVDEAHMITTQGFNALLKIVEEPPEHVVFVFATTEPEKVLPTIRSRTHHYPFRLIPPGTLRKLLERICAEEGVAVAPAVYPLVIRAGGGSARDSLSVLDQLVAGAGPEGVTYERAVALLGVTDVSLIDDVVDALAAGDRAAVFEAVDRLVEAGHDPRRFATDLLQRLRDLTLLQAVPEAIARGIVEAADDEVTRMVEQAGKFGAATLTRYGEILHVGLTEMRGATAPRLLLELLCARMLLPAATTAEPGLLERLERLERRSDIASTPPAPGESVDDAERPKQFGRPSTRPAERGPAGAGGVDTSAATPSAAHGLQTAESGARSTPHTGTEHAGRVALAASGSGGGEGHVGVPVAASAAQSESVGTSLRGGPGPGGTDAVGRPRSGAPSEVAAGSSTRGQEAGGGVGGERPEPGASTDAGAGEVHRPDPGVNREVGAADVRRVWQEIQDAVKQRKKRTAALLVSATVRAVDHDTLVLSIGTAPLARLLSEQSNTDVIAEALHAVLGVRWRVRCEYGDSPPPQTRGAGAEQRQAPAPSSTSAAPGRGAAPGVVARASVGGQGVGGQGSSSGPGPVGVLGSESAPGSGSAAGSGSPDAPEAGGLRASAATGRGGGPGHGAPSGSGGSGVRGASSGEPRLIGAPPSGAPGELAWGEVPDGLAGDRGAAGHAGLAGADNRLSDPDPAGVAMGSGAPDPPGFGAGVGVGGSGDERQTVAQSSEGAVPGGQAPSGATPPNATGAMPSSGGSLAGSTSSGPLSGRAPLGGAATWARQRLVRRRLVRRGRLPRTVVRRRRRVGRPAALVGAASIRAPERASGRPVGGECGRRRPLAAGAA